MSEAARDYSENLSSALRASEERLHGGLAITGSFYHDTVPYFPTDPVVDTGELPQEQISLADVINLPDPQPITEPEPVQSPEEDTLPSTGLDTSEVKAILTNDKLSETERIEHLLTLAYRGGSIIESSIPPLLRANITESPADWYHARDDLIKEILAERKNIASIYEQTDVHQQIPFLRNAAQINEVAWIHHQGEIAMRTELAARLIILEAMTASD